MSEEIVERARDGFARAAQGWDRWSDLMGQRDDGPRYVEAAGVRPRDRVVEIGAGTGEQTLVLARTVGRDGHVLATDLTEQMIDVARRRVRAAGLDNVTFKVAGVSELDADDGPFDAAVSGLTWMFLPDPVGAAVVARELLRPGGGFAASVWGSLDQVPMVSVPMGAALQEMNLEPPPGEAQAALDLSDPAVFHDVLVDAGFQDVTVEPFRFTVTWPSPSVYVEWARDVLINLADLIDEHAADRHEQVYAAIERAVADHARADGRVTFDNTALMAAAQRTT